jgi:hypothetical protein
VDLENWVDLGEPTTARDAHEAEVVENKIIDCYPRAGVLEPGERTMVRPLHRLIQLIWACWYHKTAQISQPVAF